MRPPTKHLRAPLERRSMAWRGRAIVGALALALGTAAVSCASAPGSPPRRNGMEAPPPFPVAPDFNVPDALGRSQTVSSLMGPKGLVLVLYRGHW